MIRSLAPRLGVAIVIAVAGCLPRVARADDEAQKTAAEVLFDDGRRLMREGHYDEACPKLQRSQKIAPALGTLLNLGLCYEKNGQSASAWVTYREASAQAVARHDDDRAAFATERLAAIQADLTYLTINVSREIGAVRVQRDGEDLPAASWGIAVPIDPGSHTIEASAPGHTSFTTRIEAAPRHTYTIDVPQLATDVASPPASTPEVAPKAPSAPAAAPTVVWVLGGAAGTALVTGAVLGVVAKVEYDGASCRGDVCTSAGTDQRTRAFDEAKVATIAFVAAGVLAASAVVVWATTRRADAPVSVALGPAVARLRIAF